MPSHSHLSDQDLITLIKELLTTNPEIKSKASFASQFTSGATQGCHTRIPAHRKSDVQIRRILAAHGYEKETKEAVIKILCAEPLTPIHTKDYRNLIPVLFHILDTPQNPPGTPPSPLRNPPAAA